MDKDASKTKLPTTDKNSSGSETRIGVRQYVCRQTADDKTMTVQ